ncbi:hypothetical protein OQA88_12679 [Cercophora sp. LCS_1]
MRLINCKTLELSEFFGDNIPKYAILSHTWSEEEATFQDWNDLKKVTKKEGYVKIQGACAKAREDGWGWLWVDTNCIDKTSSAELTEAINSMFSWYARSEACYAYLSDVPSPKGELDEAGLTNLLGKSRWFTRGWTLQELLAPSDVTFFAKDWTKLGDKHTMAATLASITRIDKAFLTDGSSAVQSAPIAEKMLWLAKRTTTRTEDMAYCMFGLFDINMPLLYGEGTKAFTRLQEEIIKVSNDHTIFCWSWNSDVPDNWTSLLAHSPSQFEDTNFSDEIHKGGAGDEISIYSMTNAGLSIRLPVLYAQGWFYVLLEARPSNIPRDRRVVMGVRIYGSERGSVLHAWRTKYPNRPVVIETGYIGYGAGRVYYEHEARPLLVMHRPPKSGEHGRTHAGQRRTDEALCDHFSRLNHVMPVSDSLQFWVDWEPFFNCSASCLGQDRGIFHLGSCDEDEEGLVRACFLKTHGFWPPEGKHEISVYIFIAIKEHPSTRNRQTYCQLFLCIPESLSEDPQIRNKAIDQSLQELKQGALEAQWEQPVSYCAALDLWIKIDLSNVVLRNDTGLAFLRISQGKTPPDLQEWSASSTGNLDAPSLAAWRLPPDYFYIRAQTEDRT